MTPAFALALAGLALAVLGLAAAVHVNGKASDREARLARRLHRVERDLAWHLAGRKSPPPPHDCP
jgi:hypothetical protein